MIDKFKEAFKEEALELLNQLEDLLLELEENPTESEPISAVFRTMHTIKGSSAMFGFEKISKFTHEIESIMDDVREGKLKVTKELINLSLEARDHIKKMLVVIPGSTEEIELSEYSEILIKKFFDALKINEQSVSKTKEEDTDIRDEKIEQEVVPIQEIKQGDITYRIIFKPKIDIFLRGTRPILLIKELIELGFCTIICNVEEIPDLENIDPEKCYTSWELFLTTSKNINNIKDVFIFVEDNAFIKIEEMHEFMNKYGGEEHQKKLGEILIERGVIKNDEIIDILHEQKRIGEILVEKKLATEKQVKSALEEQEHIKKISEKRRMELTSQSIRVNSEKLDKLVDLVGELVTVQARLSQTSKEIYNNEVLSISEQIERLTAELRDNTMSMRMLPIGSTFNKFRRLVRDLSIELGKEIELVTEGEETELDKTVIEKLNDPLIHIIRNSIDHGIEKPETRRALGKNRTGTIKLKAIHAGTSVLINIEDDGIGIDRKEIRKKAIQRNIIREDESLSDSELLNLIFHQGLSTAQNVTSVSGRGVGMDVVKKGIENLGGQVNIESFEKKGTTIILKLPLTLAIIEGLLTRIGDAYFIFPLSSVGKCIELISNQGSDVLDKNSEIFNDNGNVLPFIHLRKLFKISGERPLIEQIVVIKENEKEVGFVVDQVLGDYQTVIKSLGKMFKEMEGISGATILGDGTVALIVDTLKLTEIAKKAEAEKVEY